MSADLGWLSRLALHVRRGMGERPGDRRFPGRPQSAGIEVEAHRAYAPGDDLRHLDWNAVGRLDTLLVRRFTAERELCVHVLLDASASMAVPPADRKFAHACELTLAIAFVALSSNDAVRIAVLRDHAPPRRSRVFRQRAGVLGVAAFLADVTAAGALALGDALEAYACGHVRPGAAVLVSDFMTEPAEVERGVAALRARGWEVLLLQVLGAEERAPARGLAHSLLRDVETGATHPVRLDADTRARYAALLDEHLTTLAALAARSRALYARLDVPGDVSGFLTGELARSGVIRRR
jgi:uncharacterized protein (DUF58 family)